MTGIHHNFVFSSKNLIFLTISTSYQSAKTAKESPKILISLVILSTSSGAKSSSGSTINSVEY